MEDDLNPFEWKIYTNTIYTKGKTNSISADRKPAMTPPTGLHNINCQKRWHDFVKSVLDILAVPTARDVPTNIINRHRPQPIIIGQN